MKKKQRMDSDTFINTEAWGIVETYLNKTMAYVVGRLETCKPEELGKYQAQIKLIRDILQLPELVEKRGNDV